MTQEPAARRQFADIMAGPDDQVDLAQAALLIACEEYPDLDVARYLRRVEQLAREVATRVEEDPGPLAAESALDVAGLVEAAVAETRAETFTFPILEAS